jgi:CheY-like chemotaxis protein
MLKSATVNEFPGDYVPRILLADDSTHAQRMGSKILSAEGIEVITVSNGDAAVKKLQEIEVDLVLADVYMPGLDGYEVCERIKSSPDHAGLPVILLVGALEPYEPDRIAQVHADGVLRKPFEASAVLETVRPLLQASLATRPHREPPASEQTVATSPSPPPAEQVYREDTVEMPAPDFEATMRLSPPKGSHDIAEPPAAAPSSASAVGMAAAPAPQSSAEEAPPLAEMAVAAEIPPMSEFQAGQSAIADFAVPAPSDEYTPGEFAIPDVSGDHEGGAESAALSGALDTVAEPVAPVPEPSPVASTSEPPPSRWVAEPVPVSPEDHARLIEVSKPEPSKSKSSKKGDAPPDWGELLKSVEGTTDGSAPPPAAVAPAPGPGADLELEIPAEEAPAAPVPAPAPAIDEEELRMAVQLCLESALPGLVDEITSAILRRLKAPG